MWTSVKVRNTYGLRISPHFHGFLPPETLSSIHIEDLKKDLVTQARSEESLCNIARLFSITGACSPREKTTRALSHLKQGHFSHSSLL